MPFKDSEKRRIYHREYYGIHRKRRSEQDRKYRQSHKSQIKEAKRKYKEGFPLRARVYRKIRYKPENYPLDDKCAFCGRTGYLERGHLDYEDDGFNYLTVCRACNVWMEK